MNGGIFDGIKCICHAFFHGPLCDFTVDVIPSDRCMGMIAEGFKEFYDPISTSDGLMCVSHCHPTSPKFTDCNGGICGLEIRKGPTCRCPKSDIYMYTQPRCMGRISKIGLFSGVGVTIGVLLILLVVLVILYMKTKNKVPQKQTDEEAYYSTLQ
ncbi:mucin-3A-like [Phyllobates terribilis]|uniref:mucin-3A-like n=1 Tax=Phyllobates terribilis TaxID=111132 RepID=UPI003CCB6F31